MHLAISMSGFCNTSLIGFQDTLSIHTKEYIIESEEVKLFTTLFLPEGEGPFPTVVLIHSAGKFATSFYKPVAVQLCNRGFATLIYDKRGTGESTGRYEDVNSKSSEKVLSQLAKDAINVINFIKKLPEVKTVGLLGTSQGGWIVPIICSQSQDINFAVNISGPAVTVAEELYFSKLTGDEKPGQTYDTGDGLSIEEATAKVREMKPQKSYDPTPYIAKMDIPSFWLYGNLDRSVPVQLSMERLNQTPNKSLITIKNFEDANHSLINVKTQERVTFWDEIVTWIQNILK